MNNTSLLSETNESSKQLKNIYLLGAVSTCLVLIGIIIDMVVGSITGADISALPQTAVERFAQFNTNPLLGLYNMDLLNTINQILMIPAFFALFIALRNANFSFSLLALVVFLVGTTIFIANNTALTMYDLSTKYATATTNEQKLLYAAAGEAMLTKGEHGSLGVFFSFLIPNIANIIISVVMLSGSIFSKTTAYTGLLGSSLMIVYILLVSFVSAAEKIALIIAAPGGLLCMAWFVLFMVRFMALRKTLK